MKPSFSHSLRVEIAWLMCCLLYTSDMKYILRRMEKYGISSEKKIESAIHIVANENRYHPIRDYLNGLDVYKRQVSGSTHCKGK